MARRIECAAFVVAAAVGCSGDAPQPPKALADGSPARPAPVALEGGDVSVMTRVRILNRGAIGPSGAASCRGVRIGDSVALERIGVSGRTVTSHAEERAEIRACDSVAREGRGTWCGHAYARLREGMLRDPRLSLSCRDSEGEPVGFAWVQPHPEAAFVVVASPEYDEVYPTAENLPVRVMTGDVDPASASATFAVSEHARDGLRLRSYELEARVSG